MTDAAQQKKAAPIRSGRFRSGMSARGYLGKTPMRLSLQRLIAAASVGLPFPARLLSASSRFTWARGSLQ